jgi:hypothetical protein
MHRSIPSYLCTLLLFACSQAATAQGGKLLYDELKRPANAVFHHTPLGLCEDYPEESTTLDLMRKDLELLQRTGVRMLRISFGWDGIETEKDQYDWLFWDDFVKMAVDEYGITLIPYICYTPLWNSTSQDPGTFWRSPPKDYDEFGQFMTDLVNRYKGRIKTWELWNEPDIEWYWMGDQEGFTRLLKTGSDAVRRADPTATVVMGGIAHDTGWFRRLLRDHQAAQYVDVFNMHNYYETWADHPLEDIGPYINEVAEIVQRYGEGEPVWMAEVGYSTHRTGGARISDDYTAYYAYEHTPAYQAVDLVRRITAALATEKLSALAWYEVKDLPPASETIGDQQNNSTLGVALADHSPKPAAQALTFLNRFYGEPMRSLDREVKTLVAPGSDAVVHAFEQEDGDVIVVGWLRTRVKGRQGDVGKGEHPDPRAETVPVTVPRKLAGQATLYDALGNAQPSAHRHGAAETTLDLKLEGGKVSLVHLAK